MANLIDSSHKKSKIILIRFSRLRKPTRKLFKERKSCKPILKIRLLLLKKRSNLSRTSFHRPRHNLKPSQVRFKGWKIVSPKHKLLWKELSVSIKNSVSVSSRNSKTKTTASRKISDLKWTNSSKSKSKSWVLCRVTLEMQAHWWTRSIAT